MAYSKKLKFIPTSNIGSDCTASYDVLLDEPMTVEEFIAEVLSNKEDWGHIGIRNGIDIYGKPSYEYNHGKLYSRISKKIKDRKIAKVSAHGGWSLMEYLLTLED